MVSVVRDYNHQHHRDALSKIPCPWQAGGAGPRQRNREQQDWRVSNGPGQVIHHILPQISCIQTQRPNLTKVESGESFALALRASYRNTKLSPGSIFEASRVIDVSSKRQAPDIDARRLAQQKPLCREEVEQDTQVVMFSMCSAAQRHVVWILNHYAHQLLHSCREGSIANTAFPRRQRTSYA